MNTNARRLWTLGPLMGKGGWWVAVCVGSVGNAKFGASHFDSRWIAIRVTDFGTPSASSSIPHLNVSVTGAHTPSQTDTSVSQKLLLYTYYTIQPIHVPKFGKLTQFFYRIWAATSNTPWHKSKCLLNPHGREFNRFLVNWYPNSYIIIFLC